MKDKLLALSIMFRTKLDEIREAFNDESGQDLVEYALIIALVAVAAVASMGTLAKDINNVFTNVGNQLTTNG